MYFFFIILWLGTTVPHCDVGHQFYVCLIIALLWSLINFHKALVGQSLPRVMDGSPAAFHAVLPLYRGLRVQDPALPFLQASCCANFQKPFKGILSLTHLLPPTPQLI